MRIRNLDFEMNVTCHWRECEEKIVDTLTEVLQEDYPGVKVVVPAGAEVRMDCGEEGVCKVVVEFEVFDGLDKLVGRGVAVVYAVPDNCRELDECGDDFELRLVNGYAELELE